MTSCDAGEESPGPAEYSKTASDLPRAPDYSCRNKCRPVFPDILLYPEYGTTSITLSIK